ncbi:MAG: hypothetical protein KatS3mg101_0815 [Patescibacteria group bacterium]|nr:MAG: hypothetical protein KatS3mg101_0815 [Patescibacteria group bacterium]
MIVYKHLENFWPYNDKPPFDHRLDNETLVVIDAEPGEYTTDQGNVVTLYDYRKVPVSDTNKLGRHKNEFTCVDVVFSTTETDERGFWNNWRYDLRESTLAELVMSLVEGLENEYEVVRKLVVKVNEILEGCWDCEKFNENTSPLRWKRTREITREYHVNRSPVKYGQCWVFSELLTSMFRFLGIKSRTVFIKNARIDRGENSGIDIELVTTKGDDFIELDFKPSFSSVPCNDNFSAKVNRTFYHHGYKEMIDTWDYIVRGDTKWNYHLWNEVFLDQEWCCLDGSPTRRTKIEDKYYDHFGSGPVHVSCIKFGEVCNGDFDYFNSTVNSVFRYWRTEVIDNRPFVIPFKIVYSSDHQHPIKILTNSTGVFGKIVIDRNYKPEDAKEHHLKNHPVLIERVGKKIKLLIRKKLEGDFYFQFCQLRHNFDEYQVVSLNVKRLNRTMDYKLPKIRSDVNLLSLLMIDLNTRKWWASVC